MHGGSIDTDTHGRQFDRLAEDRVPDEDIAVKRPVVVVGSAVIVFESVGERSSDAFDKNGAAFLTDRVLPLFGREVGVTLQQVFRADEGVRFMR